MERKEKKICSSYKLFSALNKSIALCLVRKESISHMYVDFYYIIPRIITEQTYFLEHELFNFLPFFSLHFLVWLLFLLQNVYTLWKKRKEKTNCIKRFEYEIDLLMRYSPLNDILCGQQFYFSYLLFTSLWKPIKIHTRYSKLRWSNRTFVIFFVMEMNLLSDMRRKR